MDEIVQEFLVESHENLDQLDSDLLALEQEPGSRALLGSIFRTIHTIKGTSGFLAFNRLEEVAHVGENMLSRLRDGALALTPARTSVLLRMLDTVRSLLASIEATGGEGSVDVSAVVADVSAAMEDAPAAEVAAGEWTLAETQPLSTYLVALVAGPYHVVRNEHDGIPLGLSARASIARHCLRSAMSPWMNS